MPGVTYRKVGRNIGTAAAKFGDVATTKTHLSVKLRKVIVINMKCRIIFIIMYKIMIIGEVLSAIFHFGFNIDQSP